MEGEMRRRLFSCPEGVTHPNSHVTPMRKRRRSIGDLQLSIQDAYNDSVDGKLSDANKAAIASAFHITEQDVLRKFRNRRTFMEEKARKELIKNSVTSAESPAIDEIAGLLKMSSRRVKECLSKYHCKIVTAIHSENAMAQEEPKAVMKEETVKAKGWLAPAGGNEATPPFKDPPFKDISNCSIT